MYPESMKLGWRISALKNTGDSGAPDAIKPLTLVAIAGGDRVAPPGGALRESPHGHVHGVDAEVFEVTVGRAHRGGVVGPIEYTGLEAGFRRARRRVLAAEAVRVAAPVVAPEAPPNLLNTIDYCRIRVNLFR